VKQLEKNFNFDVILYFAVLVTLALTPMFNSDSLIIPKLVLLFALGMYMLPNVLENLKYVYHDKKLRLLAVLAIIFILQMILSMLASSTPFEQQFFGRTGRGLGFITYFSLIIILLSSAIFIKKSGLNKLLFWLVISSGITSLYSLMQRFGLDIFEWETKTNGIIGTLGNPNFQGSFAAMALVPALVYFWSPRTSRVYSLSFSLILITTIVVCQSTQGYIAALASISIYLLIYAWYKGKPKFYSLLILVFLAGLVALAGMLNKGPLAAYLYKISVQSRGEMWRTAFNAANNNPFLGTGPDSFGDFSLLYRDQKTANGIAEFTDNAHNFFLQFAATGGYILALVYLAIILLSLHSFIKLQRVKNSFDKNLAAVFSAWLCFQLQSIISPASISTLTWNFIISGSLIGLSAQNWTTNESKLLKPKRLTKVFSYFLILSSILITYPLFNSDRLALKSIRTGDGNLAIVVAKSYPESVIRYSRIGTTLLTSGLYPQSLDVARSAVKFNPNAISAWILILVNESAPISERQKAKNEILRLDPFNKDVKNFIFK
jgi:O-antigen ligase